MVIQNIERIKKNMKTRLKELREKMGYTELEVAKSTGIPPATYHQLEYRTIRKTNVHTYLKLAEFYGVGLDYLLGLNTTPTFDTDIVNYQTIREIERLKNLDSSEIKDENDIMLETTDTKVLHKIINPKLIEFKNYPFNLLRDIYQLPKFTADTFDKSLVPTIVEDLEVVFDTYLTEQEKYIIKSHYVSGFTLNKIGEILNLSQQRIAQIKHRGVRKLRYTYILNNFVYNIDKDIEKKRGELEKLKTDTESIFANKKIDIATINDLNLPIRAHNALSRAGVKNLDDVIEKVLSSEILKIRNLGKTSYFDILKALEEASLITYNHYFKDIEWVAESIRVMPKAPLSILRDKS